MLIGNLKVRPVFIDGTKTILKEGKGLLLSVGLLRNMALLLSVTKKCIASNGECVRFVEILKNPEWNMEQTSRMPYVLTIATRITRYVLCFAISAMLFLVWLMTI